jgi:hypothetical protein
LFIALYKIGTTADPLQARPVLIEALVLVEKLQEEQRLPAAQKNWPELARAALAKLPAGGAP